VLAGELGIDPGREARELSERILCHDPSLDPRPSPRSRSPGPGSGGPAPGIPETADVRSALPAIGVPTLIIQGQDDRISPPCHGRYLAEHVAAARYFEQPGSHLLWVGMVAGSGISFTDRGTHHLPGIPDQWPLFAVADGHPG
jgi:pimeloyl-ACP methyl ester carboxylesterase